MSTVRNLSVVLRAITEKKTLYSFFVVNLSISVSQKMVVNAIAPNSSKFTLPTMPGGKCRNLSLKI